MMLMYLFDMVQIHITRQTVSIHYSWISCVTSAVQTIMKLCLIRTKIIS